MASRARLFIGNRNYSSWSLRAHLALVAAEVEFEETLIVLDAPTSAAELATHSPTARVPVLKLGESTIWDSLAIAEWSAEQRPGLWPDDPMIRSHARCASAEMHSGFAQLRAKMPMDIRASSPGVGHTPQVFADIARIVELWREARALADGSGPFLYGSEFGIADAMYAPVATRLVTYGVTLEADIRDYVDAIHAYAPMQLWIEEAKKETWTCY